MPGAAIMMGIGAPQVAQPDVTVLVQNTQPSTSNAIFTMKSDGTWTTSDAQSGQWLVGSSNGGAYDVRATVTSGSTPGGAGVGTWLQLSSDRLWNIGQVTTGTNTGTLLIEIRPTGGGSNLDTASISLTATVFA